MPNILYLKVTSLFWVGLLHILGAYSAKAHDFGERCFILGICGQFRILFYCHTLINVRGNIVIVQDFSDFRAIFGFTSCFRCLRC